METAHKRPNYILIWVYLFVLTVAELALAFELPISRNMKLLLMLALAVWKALLVALFFMHLKFERWNLRIMALIPVPLALIFIAAVISVAGVAYLALAVNLLTAGLAALTLASYVLLYTPLKRTTTLNTLIGAVPGALPIVGGWTAAGGALGPAVAALFWILFLWQLPHFLALAWIYREDYRRGGLAMLSVGDADGRHTGRMVLLYATALLPVSLVPTLLGVTGGVYFFGALALGLAYAGASIAMTRAVTTPRAWRVFLVSIVYLPVLLMLRVLDKVVA